MWSEDPYMADTTATFRLSRRAKFTIVVLALIIWTALAGQGADKGCDLVPHSYSLVLTHGTPDRREG